MYQPPQSLTSPNNGLAKALRFSHLGCALIAAGMLAGCDNGDKTADSSTPPPVTPPLSGDKTCVAPAQILQSNLETQWQAGFPQLPALPALVEILQAPGSDRWYAVSQAGRVYWFDNNATASQLHLLIDLSSVVRYGGEMGLLGFAFHPDFASNHQLFVSYSDNNHSGRSTISRFDSDGTSEIDISTEHVILTVDQPASNHNGGQILFGPDGMFYVALGDGGGAGDTYHNGQNLNTLLGKILRLNVTHTDTYTVPADNPFIGNSSVRPEIYAYGLRNPWRFSFDRQTGALWAADVGQNTLEEVDIIKPGGNYGWPIMEASSCFNSSTCNQNGLELPVAEYNHSNGDCSISGGYVYRGSQMPALAGRYIYSDFCTGNLRATYQDEHGQYQSQTLGLTGMNISGFGQDSAGEVYALNYNGDAGQGIFHITTNTGGTGSAVPQKLSETGCFSDTKSKSVVNGVLPYSVITPLWSDGADKNRFIAVPENSKAEVLPDGDFDFPVGTVLIKNFMHDGRYLETRLLMHHQNGWGGYSYEWLPDQSDAMLLSEGKTLNIGDFAHTIPSPAQCYECHTSAAHLSLGVEASQLDFTYSYDANNSNNQNMALYQAGFLQSIPAGQQITNMASLDDTSASIELRSRSYLHANCSGCHRPGGPASHMDFRIQTAFTDMGICDTPPSAGDLGISNARLLAAGDPARSILLQRMKALNDNRMPPVASHRVDDDAVSIISQWITSISSCTP